MRGRELRSGFPSLLRARVAFQLFLTLLWCKGYTKAADLIFINDTGTHKLLSCDQPNSHGLRPRLHPVTLVFVTTSIEFVEASGRNWTGRSIRNSPRLTYSDNLICFIRHS